MAVAHQAAQRDTKPAHRMANPDGMTLRIGCPLRRESQREPDQNPLNNRPRHRRSAQTGTTIHASPNGKVADVAPK